MNVDHKSAHVAQAGAANARGGKPKTQGADGMADAGGFLSVLMSLGTADGAGEALSLTDASDLSADDGKLDPLFDLSQQQGLIAGQGGAQGADVAQILQQQGLIAGQGGAQGADVAQILQQQGLIAGQGEAQGTDTGPAQPSRAPGQVGAVAAAQTAGQNGLARPVPEGLEAGSVPAKKTGAGASNKLAATLATRSGQELPVGKPDAIGGPGARGVPLTEATSASTIGALSEQMVVTAPAGESVRQAVRQLEKSNGAVVNTAAEGAWGTSTFQVGGQMDVQTAAASVSGASPEAAIAEQVYYWMSNDVQNAELKLDNWGQSPVEVSISLQGNEARVEFRSDVQEIRQILEGASAQLKDMLQGEGLILAGVSVGASGAGGAGAREQAPRSEVRRATVTLPESAALEQPRRAGASSGRSVDVFV